jgi:hypothetical protein
MSLFGTASSNKPVIKPGSIDILKRILFQVTCGALRTDSWKYKKLISMDTFIKMLF